MADQSENANFFAMRAVKPSARYWLIALAIVAVLLGGLWALWSIGSASASAPNALVFHPSAQDAGQPAPVRDQHKQTRHGSALQLAGNDGLSHLPYLGEIHGADLGGGIWFISPGEMHSPNTLPVGDDGFSFPGGGNWHDFGNQSMGLGISGPGAGGGGGLPTSNLQGDKHSADNPSDPGPSDSSDPSNNDDSPGPGLTDQPGNPPDVLTSSVPEPATWAIMLIGFGAIGFAMRRKKELAV